MELDEALLVEAAAVDSCAAVCFASATALEFSLLLTFSSNGLSAEDAGDGGADRG